VKVEVFLNGVCALTEIELVQKVLEGADLRIGCLVIAKGNSDRLAY
jgi:hypothetical protein